MRTNHLLALLPLVAFAFISPKGAEVTIYRKVASTASLSTPTVLTPKIDARVKEIGKNDVKLDPNIKMETLIKNIETFTIKLTKLKDEFKIELSDKEKSLAQKNEINKLLKELIILEESQELIQEELIHYKNEEKDITLKMNDLKVTLEGLLQAEVEHNLYLAHQRIKDLEDQQRPEKNEELTCTGNCQTPVSTGPLLDLIAELQKSVAAMGEKIANLQQGPTHSPPYIPDWLMSRSMVAPQIQYPYHLTPYTPSVQPVPELSRSYRRVSTGPLWLENSNFIPMEYFDFSTPQPLFRGTGPINPTLLPMNAHGFNFSS
jgi:hypothetical protein